MIKMKVDIFKQLVTCQESENELLDREGWSQIPNFLSVSVLAEHEKGITLELLLSEFLFNGTC